MKRLSLGILALTAMPAISFAGNGGVILYRPVASAVPTTGGTALIIVAALLALIGFRMMKQREQSGTNWLVAAIAVSAMVSAGSGIKLISDAVAGPSVLPMSSAGGGRVDIPHIYGTECFIVQNQTPRPQEIYDINAEPGHSLGACTNGGIIIANGGEYRGTCSDDPSTVLGSGEICDIEVSFFK